MDSGFLLGTGPTGALPPRGKIQAGYWRGFRQLVEREGGNHRRILERHDIDPENFEYHDYHVDCQSALELLEYCSVKLDDPLFGLHLADVQQPDAFGSIAVMARAAPTFGDAVQSLVRLTPVVNSPEGHLELVSLGDNAELRWSSRLAGDGCEQAHYHGLLLIMKTLRALGGKSFTPTHARLCCEPSSALRQEIEEKAGCTLHTRSSSNAIAFPSMLLGQRNPSCHALVYDLLGRWLAQMGAGAGQSVIENVEYFIRTSLPSGACTIERCATRMETSARALQKQLARRDTSFSMLLEKQRHELARNALTNSHCTIDEIAFNLGYAEQSSFGRAFKRWTGLSPQAFRLQSHLTQ